jgi:hypothetical protein
VQFASFDLGDPVFELCGLRVSVQLVTLENLYGVDPEVARVEATASGAIVRAGGLRWAGGTEPAAGELTLAGEREPGGAVRLRVAVARAPAPVRSVKLLLRDLAPALEASPDGSTWSAIGEHGELFGYPGRLHTPLLFARAGGRVLGLRAAERRVREKRFALYRERLGRLAGRGAIELIHDEEATAFAPALETPDWVVAPDADRAAFEAAHLRGLEDAFALRPWEERGDVPGWARALRLVVTLHGMHWTGRVLLDYAAMQDALRFVAARIDPARVLAYLPGWEGRYYWQYGDYRPDPRLGGERGFARLCDEARRLGVRLMPMFGVNCVNARLPRFRTLAARSYLKTATGNRFHGNTPDWDLSRAHDTGWQAWLNPGDPWWRDELAGQIETLAARHGLQAVFLDTTEIWTNDPDHPVADGIALLCRRLREAIPELLLAGEYDYDALAASFPLFQRAWWMPAPAWTRRYVRRFAHLCEGEPEGRTGVHELGRFRPGPVAAEAGFLATIALQDGTLERSRAAVEAALLAAASD